MNRIIKRGLFVVCLGMLMGSCQTERNEVLTEDESGFKEGSEFHNLVARAAMHDGSEDDPIDNSSCFSIQFPYTLLINNLEMKVQSASDLKKILEKVGEETLDVLSPKLPVTLVLGNYERVTVDSFAQLSALQRSCSRDLADGNAAITCLEIEFPIELFVYNIQSQKTSSANIASKEQLYVFLQNQSPFEILSFDYPITISFSEKGEEEDDDDDDDDEIEINNLTEFRMALENCED